MRFLAVPALAPYIALYLEALVHKVLQTDFMMPRPNLSSLATVHSVAIKTYHSRVLLMMHSLVTEP